jgi:antitoxin component of MazEF toxin-antitoxin module
MVKQLETEKIIKKWGNSTVIRMNNDDLKIIDATVGDMVKVKVEKKQQNE